ncbi:Secreted protein containing bacterial Ig-like domain and vWFA domain (YfbK) [Commensalibacter communis]|uniref:Secreted protein containing bacterial Ig-like domain and vWFA domain (YfbK) n=1 Tax=Commensalibacter communis TaxID=2972786 RepID=A0A9W4XD39_9PROT|nr:CHAP domain-containing protein [Commensalibacter communis]CAI3939505.1 Secreted protein containing bacterial Ig-like domain and vWFA domain (YfbK) [Commensalibacter communis]CAI3940846.1 Secreted protein containing bacterial Ig-like domain and vWFA domain (YfbK) [Commensalibacter communis]CAI3944004.1 Secreted protein containing bacterial Ig-like domain and vWFA domain (YfbK) [Commensalibacter communis]CAI3945793.1 Secreted protein containing bacterial Ig-like domain and vWFA domain (YfbK) [
MKKYIVTIILIIGFLCFSSYWAFTHVNFNPSHHVGEVIDELNSVKVYYNGGMNNVTGRNLAPDGYNLGLKYQCVEFVKRYYYEFYHHKILEAQVNAKDFLDMKTPSGQINCARGLLQFDNGTVQPQIGDLLIFKGYLLNPYGRVAIISKVTDHNIEIIQQNPGPFTTSRVTYRNTTNQA